MRVGNAANRQIQLDVFGPIADLVAAVAQARGFVRDSDWHVVQEMVRAVERRWHEPDHGIWEARMAPRHHVYSKVMCWLTVARGIEVQELRGEPVPSEWVELRDRIRANVLCSDGTMRPARTPLPTVTRTSTPPRSGWASRGSSPTTIRAFSRRC